MGGFDMWEFLIALLAIVGAVTVYRQRAQIAAWWRTHFPTKNEPK